MAAEKAVNKEKTYEEGLAELLPKAPKDIPRDLEPLWHVLLRLEGRPPPRNVFEKWAERLSRGMDARMFLRQLVNSPRFRKNKFVHTAFPPGHFFSPVVDPDTVQEYLKMVRQVSPKDIAGINFDIEAMESFWNQNRELIAATPFTEQPSPGKRYYYRGGPYIEGDAITLRAMMAHWRPRRIIEIGSGFSSACMLDNVDEFGLNPFHLTCIEPHPKRLLSLLRPEDYERVTIHEKPVQDITLDVFRELEPGDFLFIDSTHVLKTGSDVHYEIFYILPSLKSGVLIHFHDCAFPFEYSNKKIFEKNFSWNEVYAVRALLMDSTRYRIYFWGSLFALERRDLVAETSKEFLSSPGGSLWLIVN